MVISSKCNKVEVKLVDDNDVHNFKNKTLLLRDKAGRMLYYVYSVPVSLITPVNLLSDKTDN